MSYDLVLWHAPDVASRSEAQRQRRSPKRPTARRTAALEELRRVLIAEVPGATWSVEPVVDAREGTLGVALTGPGVEAGTRSVLAAARKHGFACHDPQTDTYSYADGSDSRSEVLDADGVHEGVGICLRELSSDPPPPPLEQLEALDALLQFALADSEDDGAAVTVALPVVVRLLASPDAAVRERAVQVAAELLETAVERDREVDVDEDTVAFARAHAHVPYASRLLSLFADAP